MGQQAEAFSRLDELISKHCSRFPEVPLLFAICAPCQPFTKLSKAKLSEDRVAVRLRDRGLLAEACCFVERYAPDMLLSENVSGIADARYGGVWEDFANRLRDTSYNVATRRVCTSNFGIPQYRKRSILAGIRTAPEQVFDPFELPTEDTSAAIRTVAETLDGLPLLEAGQKHKKILNHVTRRYCQVNRFGA